MIDKSALLLEISGPCSAAQTAECTPKDMDPK